ncbi:hypothetical protein [Caballeronia sordidicola]|uniref:hypothetical protein n=1 Tax=Caballeronia sordidicola TaxID=196367 RepID=UPI00117E610D|nr:hypothetical protein [Caballeronia sordidicola]
MTILVDELVDHAEYKKAKYDQEVGPQPWMIDEKPWRHLPCPTSWPLICTVQTTYILYSMTTESRCRSGNFDTK